MLDCLTDIIDTLNRHPHPAVQLSAMSTAVAKILHTGTGNDMSKADDVEGMIRDFSERTLNHWRGFASGMYDQDQLQ